MGIYDRDYYRTSGPGGVGQARMWSITTWLIVLNVAVFLLDRAWLRLNIEQAIARGANPQNISPNLMGYLEAWGYFSIDKAVVHGQMWRVISCQFLHAGILHLAVNMFGLYLFGPVVELVLGARRFGFFYLLCGVAGPVLYTGLWAAHVLIHDARTPLIGASAGIFGVMIAAACVSPERLISLYFFDMRLKYFAWIMMAIAGYTVLVHGSNDGGQAAHLGGGFLGYMLIRHPAPLEVVAPKRRVRGRKIKDWSRDFNR